ncbi:MAG: hypothetical protein M3Y87_02595 [Myxococcota bacterium]|nr:hypothetical protein [Myxococcota bacterium]
MRESFQEDRGNESDEGDNSSEPRPELRRSVEPPYRDRREALVARRRALAREHEETARAVERRERIARQLVVIDDELRTSVEPLLASIAIGTPCRTRWDDMIGNDVVRRCGQCDRDVHDLSRMTRDEVHRLLALADETPCVRLRRRSDGRVVTADCPPPDRKTIPRAIACAAAGAVLGMTASGVVTMAMAPPGASVEPRPSVVVASAPSAVERSREQVRVEALRATPEPWGDDVGDAIMGDVSFEPPREETPLDLDREIRWTAPQSWEVSRAVIERGLDAPTGRSSRVIPRERGGRGVGIAVYGIRRADLLGRLGLQNGDTILEINGHELAEPDTALRAYAQLRSANSFFVRIERRGRERLHVYRVVP